MFANFTTSAWVRVTVLWKSGPHSSTRFRRESTGPLTASAVVATVSVAAMVSIAVITRLAAPSRAADAGDDGRTGRHCLPALGTVRDYGVPGARYDLVIVSPEDRPGRALDGARRAHPGARILGYLNTMDVNQQAIAASDALRANEDWYLHDAQGTRVQVRVATHTGGRARYGMHVGNPGYQEYLGGRALAILRAGYDGLHLDNIETDSSYQADQVGRFISALPRELTAGTWPQAQISLLQSLRRRIDAAGMASRSIFINQIRSSEPEVSLLYLEQVEGASSEAWLDRARRMDGPSGWLARVRHAAAVAAGGKDLSVLSLVKEITREECLYVYGSYLLATDGEHLHFFLGSAYRPAATAWQDFYDADLGSPSAPMAEEGAVYQRAFAKGLVVVNPRETPSAWTAPADHRLLDGSAPPASLPGRSALIMKRIAS